MLELRTLDATGETVLTGRTWPRLLAGKPTDLDVMALAGSTTTVVYLATGPSDTDALKDLFMVITAGTGANQAAIAVTAYDPTAVKVTLASALGVAPDATSELRFFLAEKRCLQNVGDDVAAGQLVHERNGDSDGYLYARHGLDENTRSCPFSVVVTKAAGAGTFVTTGTKGIRLAAVYGGLETNGSVEKRITLTDTAEEITITWEEDGSPDTIRIYATDTPGTFPADSLVDEISGGVGTYTWTGAAPATGVPAAANLTGGDEPAYGVPPTLVQTALSVGGGLKSGQQLWYWSNRDVPAATPSAGNPRSFIRAYRESV